MRTKGSFASDVKEEIISQGFSTDCCKRAYFSAVIRSAGSLLVSGERLYVVISTENEHLFFKLDKICKSLFDCELDYDGREILLKGDNVGEIMLALGIFKKVNGETEILTGIDKRLIVSECCRVNYIRGVFTAAGSVTVKKGYHLSISIANPVFGEEVCTLISTFGIKASTLVRAGKFMIYVKDSESISDFLALMGAGESVAFLNSEMVLRQFRQETNRINNCEVANIGKTVEVSVKQTTAIKKLYNYDKFASLKGNLRETAQLRMQYPDDSYSELCTRAGISKSTLKYRLNKLVEIAENTTDNGGKNSDA